MQNEQVTSTTSSFKTFAFIDLETTGLPGLDFSSTKITQLSIVACSVDHINDIKNKDDIPRVLHKLSLCFNPRKLIKIDCYEITGLSNELLQNERKIDGSTIDLITNFLGHLQQPVCFVAHNGDKFDYPILLSQWKLLNKAIPESLICCDSLKIFRKIDAIYEENSKTLINGYKLTSWEKLQTQKILLMDAEILEIEELLKNYDSDNDEKTSMTVSQLETEFIGNEAVTGIKNEVDEVTARQFLNETTPNKPVKYDEKNLHAKQPENNESRKRTLTTTARRELFPETADQPSPSNSTTKNGKKVYPRGYYTLREIYKRFFDTYPQNSHDAEADVIALLKCVCACKKEFLDVAMRMAYNFCDVKV